MEYTNGKTCSDELFELLVQMRNAQKMFFSSKPGSQEKGQALLLAKQTEKELDEFLKERGSTQTKLF